MNPLQKINNHTIAQKHLRVFSLKFYIEGIDSIDLAKSKSIESS